MLEFLEMEDGRCSLMAALSFYVLAHHSPGSRWIVDSLTGVYFDNLRMSSNCTTWPRQAQTVEYRHMCSLSLFIFIYCTG